MWRFYTNLKAILILLIFENIQRISTLTLDPAMFIVVHSITLCDVTAHTSCFRYLMMYEKEDDILRYVTKIVISLRSQKDIEVLAA